MTNLKQYRRRRFIKQWAAKQLNTVTTVTLLTIKPETQGKHNDFGV